MSPTNPAPGSRPGFTEIQHGLALKRQSPPRQQQQQQQQQPQLQQLQQYGNHQQHKLQLQLQQPPPLSQEQTLSPSSSITTNASLVSTSLGFGGTRGSGRDSSVLTPVMSAIDEDEHERQHKHALSIIPSSSFSNFASGLAGLAADAHYHHQPPPLSAVSGVSASVFSDLLSEAGAGTGVGAVDGEELSPEELQKDDPLAIQVWRLYARTKANLPHAQRMENLTWRMVGMALRRKQLEEQQKQMQEARHHHHHHRRHHPQQYPAHDQLMHMKEEEEEEEHKIVPAGALVDVPERGRRAQKFGGPAAILGPMTSLTTTSAPTITRSKAKMRVEGFDMPEDGDGDGDGCVFLFLFFIPILPPPSV
jgi:hypothetical protein